MKVFFSQKLWFLIIRTIQNRFWDSAVTRTPFTEDDFLTSGIKKWVYLPQ